MTGDFFNMRKLEKEIATLRYHQTLLLHIIQNSKAQFDLLVVEKNITKEEVEEIFNLCEVMSKKLSMEKAEGFMNFQPLFSQLERKLTPKLSVKELVESCLIQGLYETLMQEMKKFIH